MVAETARLNVNIPINYVLIALGFVINLVFAPMGMTFPVDEWRKPYTTVGEAWENNSLGIGERVPEPWIPVKREKGKLTCWGREFRFSDGFLFDQVVTQGKELFSSKPVLEIGINGKRIGDRGVEWKVTDEKDSGIEMQALVEGSEGVLITMRTRLEFDGFIRFDLKFSSHKAFTLDKLRLEFPIAEQNARIYSKYLDYDYVKETLDYNSLKKSAGYLNGSLSFPFSPSLWIGNFDIGVEWVCDTNLDWQTRNVNDSISIKRTNNSYLFAANMVDGGKNISKETIYSFGFYITPVKKPMADWRRYLFTTDLMSTRMIRNIEKHKPYAIIFPWPERECPLKIHGLPDPYDSGENFRKYESYRKKLADTHIGYIPYTKLYMLSENAEIPDQYWKLWKASNARKWPKKGYMGGTRDINVSLNHKSIQDFYVYKICEAIKKYKINGVYIDLSTPGSHPADGVSKVDRRNIRKENKVYTPLFAHREYMKRLYIAAKQIDSSFMIIPHTGKITQLGGAFSDFVISGESLNRIFIEMGGIKKIRTIKNEVVYSDADSYVPDYFNLPPEIFPEIDCLQNNGFINVIIPQIDKRNEEVLRNYPEKEIKWSRSLIANALVYDLLIWVKRIHMKTYFGTLNLIDDFITLDDSVEHIPARQAKKFFNVQSTDDFALAAYKKNNHAMVIALNRGNSKNEAVITVPEAWLKDTGKVKTVIDAETKLQLERHDKKIRFSVGEKDFMVLYITFE